MVLCIALSLPVGRCHNKHIRAYFIASVPAVQTRFVWRYVYFKYIFEAPLCNVSWPQDLSLRNPVIVTFLRYFKSR